MSWWDRLFGRKASVLDQLPAFMTYPETKSGQSVTYATALQVSTVLACCRVLAEGISQVPLKLLRPRAEGGADAALLRIDGQCAAVRGTTFLASGKFAGFARQALHVSFRLVWWP